MVRSEGHGAEQTASRACWKDMGITLLITIARTAVLFLLLAGMVLLLVGMRNVFNPEDTATEEETRRLRSDLSGTHSGISEESVFHRFLGRTQQKPKHVGSTHDTRRI